MNGWQTVDGSVDPIKIIDDQWGSAAGGATAQLTVGAPAASLSRTADRFEETLIAESTVGGKTWDRDHPVQLAPWADMYTGLCSRPTAASSRAVPSGPI